MIVEAIVISRARKFQEKKRKRAKGEPSSFEKLSRSLYS
jgi:hypothetical protein